ncbi:multifunctional CCA addition/repair protein [Thioalkalivibrio sp. XN8]|uniref:multifunctional CCA addition/repair protein n=1 Tax=Thioalkalivibrio sp. XN8 TaxID=2712863 RepID=UPI0013EA7E98|nr:multifunctional CCA addition/repair protein [Thioalkalivibrio sp. XN8]NGP52734.1 multifunctional CCA addition/repair protein [Thioalkalivibrio sp. XN8]
MDTYLVGGAVRDELLGLPVGDRDWVVVGATPAAMERAGFRAVGRDFPVFLHPETGEEYALARTERKTAPGYRGFVVNAAPEVTLAEDLQRRDLTINAMARAADGTLVDPWGGRADLEARLLRHVSPAFAEDPVRILRTARLAARFAPLGFTVAEETVALMRDMVAAGEADALVPERVWQETRRALETDCPDEFVRVLRDCGALAVIFPELEALFGVPQPARWHPEIDTGRHLLLCLRASARLGLEPEARFAVLTHDLGKGTTPRALWPAHHGHEERSVTLLRRLCERLKVPTAFRELAEVVARYHGLCHRAAELRPATVLKLLEAADALRRPERFRQFLGACEADMKGRDGLADAPYPQAELLLRALAAAAAVEPRALVAEGLSGEALGERLRAERIAAIAAACPRD